MNNNWFDLSIETRSYINQRFAVYNINGQDAYNDSVLFPNEIKNLNPQEIIEVLKTKDISHVMPQSQYPEFKSDINNIIFEDSSVNRSRGAELMTDDELNIAKGDYYNDINHYENNLELFENLPGVLVGSTAVGLGISSFKAYDKIKKGEILLNDAPRFIMLDSGGKIIRCAIIGVCVTSGAPILVTGAFAYTLYKAKGLITSAFKGAWKVISHPITINIAAFTGVLTLDLLRNTGRAVHSIGNTTWNIATHEKTKKLGVATVKTSGEIVAGTAKGIWKVATHETTKDIAVGTIKTTGKIISGTAKGIFNLGKWALKKSK